MSVDFYPDIDKENDEIRRKVFASVADTYPIHGNKRSIHLKRLYISRDPDNRDFSAMKKKRIREQDFAATVKGDLVVKDNNGKTVLDLPDQRIMRLPKLTPNLGFIVGGTEYQITTVPRLKSGAYPRVKRTGEVEVNFNLLEGKNMSMTLDPKTKKMSVSFIGSSRKVPLVPLLESLGVTDSKMKSSLGESVISAGKTGRDRALKSFYTATTGDVPPTTMHVDALEDHVKNVFDGTAIRPDTTKAIFGKAHSKVDKGLLLDSAKRLLDISKGNAEPVNRDLPMYKEFYRPSDLLADRVDRSKTAITRKTKYLLDRPSGLINEKELAPGDLFDGPIRAFFTMSQSSMVSNQYNPLSNINGFYRSSPLGEGGLSSLHVITGDTRSTHRSGHGVVDPIQTPEGQNVGISSFLATGFRPKGKDPATRLYNTKTKKMETVTPDKVMESNVAFSDQFYKEKDGSYKPVNKQVEAFGKDGDLYKTPAKDVDYVVPDQHSMYAVALNVTPFISSNHAVRGGMIYRHMDQALPLKNREQPLVQVMKGDSKTSVEDDIGGNSAIKSPVSGTVTRIGPDYIHIKSGNKVEKVSVPRNFPLNDHKSYLNGEPVVEVGQQVKKGDLLADTNFTKGGTLAIGANMRTAFMAIPGLNFEDGIVISETAAQKLTSEHLYRKSADVGQDRIIDKGKFAQYVPTERDKLSKLDNEGVIKVGQRVEKGDVLAAVLQKREFKDGLTKLSKLRSSFKRGLEWRDASLRWESEHPGVVTDVVKKRGGFNVLIRTEEPAEVGDKLCYDDQTEVLTTEGWVSITELTPLHAVASLKNGAELRFSCPKAVHKYPVPDKMYSLETTQISMCVTEEHKLFARPRGNDVYGLHKASDMFGKRYRLKMNAEWLGEWQELFTFPALEVTAGQGGRGRRVLPSFQIRMNHFLSLLGAYLSDGYVHNDHRTVVISAYKERKTEPLHALLDEMGKRYNFREKLGKTHIASKQMAAYFKQFGRAPEKYIPSWVFELHKEQLEVLYQWLINGDEHKGTTSHSFCTTSQALADGFQRLCLHVGRAAKINRTEIEGQRDRFDVFIYRSKLFPTINHGHCHTQSGQIERWTVETGHVFCPELERDHVLYIRRNGKCHWSGNSSRHANKGIVTTILPDEEMPHNADGKPIEIALNPLTVPSRITDGQFGELGAAKAAQHDGDIALVRNNDPARQFVYFKKEQEVPVRKHIRRIKTEGGVKEIEIKAHKRTVLKSVKELLDERGISEEEEMFVTSKDEDGEPKTKSVGKVMVGPIHTMKLTHQVQKKMTARGIGPNYDASGAPLGGGSTGAQSLGGLGMFTLLAHGAEKNLEEMATVKADATQREYWYALQRGEPLPKPEVSFAFKKFTAYLEALGLNVDRKGAALTLIPTQDKEILERSAGAVDPTRVLAGHEYKPEKGGIFDEDTVGGLGGTRWGHFSLAEEMPNPLFESAIKSLTGLSTAQFSKIMGKATGPSTADDPTMGVDEEGEIVDANMGVTGPQAIRRLLDKINVDEELATAESAVSGASGTERDKLNRKVHILRALKASGLTPDVYMQRNVPVIPPIFRPIVKLPTGSLAVDDLNQLYRYIGEVNKAIAEYPEAGDPHQLNVLRAHQYDLMKALAGTGGTVYDYSKDKPQGILAKIAGPSPKFGYFQSRVLKRKQDMTAASTIIPDPKMDLDAVGIPRDLLYKAYEPLLIRQLSLSNIHFGEARKHLEQRTQTAEHALQKVISEYPLMLKRDPALHMFNVMGFKPTPVEGRAIQIHPLVTGGFNADFDGDSMRIFIPSSKQAAEEVRKMFPSKILFNRGSDRPMYVPSMDSAIGLYLFSRMDKQQSPVTYPTKAAVIEDMTERAGNIPANQPVNVAGMITTPGRLTLQTLFGSDIIPDSAIANPDFALRKKELSGYLERAARTKPNDYPDIVNVLKDIGFEHAQSSGMSFSLNEFIQAGEARDTVLDKYEGRVASAGKLKGEKRQKALRNILDSAEKDLKVVANDLADSGNRPAQMFESGEKPGWAQFKQFMLSPVLAEDGDGNLVPELIRTSYGDGMTQGVHTLASLPARQSMVQKSISVAGPGYLTKQIIAPMVDMKITEPDCKTKEGLQTVASDRDSMDRFLAQDVKASGKLFKRGTAVTPDIMGYVGDKNITVRSPQTCASPNGVCQKCFGNFPDGPPDIGMNIGVVAAQSIGERGTQLALRAFHSGGVSKSGVTSSLGRVEQILRMPKNMPGKAVLAELGGKVTDVRRDPVTGARHVTVSGKEHFVPPRMKMTVNRGMEVNAGDALTQGPKDPRELLKISGMPAVRKYLTDELHGIYKGEGIKRRMVETVVRGVTDLGVVKSSGANNNLVPGDKVSLRTVEEWNKGRPVGEQVEIEPMLIGVGRLGLDYTTDWLSRLSYEHIKDTIIEAAQRGWESDISGKKQLSRIAYGGDPNRPTS